MNEETIIQVLLIAFGLLFIFGAYFEWDFFFSNGKVDTFVAFIGKSGARIFYIVIGVILFVLSFLDIVHVIYFNLLFT